MNFSTPDVSTAYNHRDGYAVSSHLCDLLGHQFCRLHINAVFRPRERFSGNFEQDAFVLGFALESQKLTLS